MLKVYVTGYARIVLERHLTTREMKELSSAKEHAEIFDKVRDHLKSEFQKYDPVRYYMQQLRSLQQGSDESVKEYSRRTQSVVVNRELYGYTVSHMDEFTTFEQYLKLKLIYSVICVALYAKFLLSKRQLQRQRLLKKPIGNFMREHHPRVLPHCYLPLIPSTLSGTKVFSQI